MSEYYLGVDLDSSLIDLAKKKYCENDLDIEFQPLNIMDFKSYSSFMDGYFSRQPFASFSFVCLFSITMWIHLNFGDQGLHTFLQRSASLLSPVNGGSLLVEPQPWKCYKNAEKRCKKLGERNET
jgi:2-polyprenyl-3-methyl-5-hydroxy-6-metoxy-1,4-benzoquinol methylase